MGQIKGKGVPTRRTPGALGDVYTDSNTGFTYKCIGSYGVMGTPDADYQWKRIGTPGNNMQKPVKPVVKAEPKPAKDEKKVEEPKAEEKAEKKAPKKSEKKPVEKKEAAVEEKKQPHNYTQYSGNKSAE